MSRTRTMTRFTLALAVSAMLTAGSMVAVAASQTNDLTPQEIVKKSQDTYAALSSYSDEGTVVTTLGNTTGAPRRFTTRLARPNLYRIEWDQNFGTSVRKAAAWSTGISNFLKSGDSVDEYSTTQEAFPRATGSGAPVSIPGTFLRTDWGNQLSPRLEKRKNDEKVGDIDCYVLSDDRGGPYTTTLWIGKQDFLIHQVENDRNGDIMKAQLEAEAKKHPEMRAPLPQIATQDWKSVETYVNIVLNKPFSTSDFDYKPSARSKP